jgi:hypothetical protein
MMTSLLALIAGPTGRQASPVSRYSGLETIRRDCNPIQVFRIRAA